MRIKNEEVIDRFLETHNMDYFYCILADKEAERLALLPGQVTRTFKEKITTMALKHTALNDIPDYIIEEYKVEPVKDPYDDFEDIEEEYEDDTDLSEYHMMDDEFSDDDDAHLDDEEDDDL